jgi:RNA 3'-terminal phosphate cyclase
MARMIGKLTALAVSQVKRRGYYGDGGGLFLQVSASGAKSWVFRFKETGRLREMGLGLAIPSASPRHARRRRTAAGRGSTAATRSRRAKLSACRSSSTLPRR